MRIAILCLVIALAAGQAQAQSNANLIADTIEISQDGNVLATGNVVVWQNGSKITAPELRYDATLDRLFVKGPIRLTEAAGMVTLANDAQLSPDLREGILVQARILLQNNVEVNKMG